MTTRKQAREQKIELCERSEYKFLFELERLISSGYKINFEAQFSVIPGCLAATLVLKE